MTWLFKNFCLFYLEIATIETPKISSPPSLIFDSLVLGTFLLCPSLLYYYLLRYIADTICMQQVPLLNGHKMTWDSPPYLATYFSTYLTRSLPLSHPLAHPRLLDP